MNSEDCRVVEQDDRRRTRRWHYESPEAACETRENRESWTMGEKDFPGLWLTCPRTPSDQEV